MSYVPQYIEMELPMDRQRLIEEMTSLHETVGYALRDLADERFGNTTTRLGHIQQMVGNIIERNAKVKALFEVSKLLKDPPKPD